MSILVVEIIPLIAGATIAAIGYNLYFNHSSQVVGIILLVVGLSLLIRNGIIIRFVHLCGKDNTDCYLCLFRIDRNRFWYHPTGNEIPIVQCLLPNCTASSCESTSSTPILESSQYEGNS